MGTDDGDDEQRAMAALVALSETPPATDDTEQRLLSDIDPILAIVYTLATKLTLALKPPAPAYHTAVPILRDLSLHSSALAHAIRLLRDDLHGATFSKLVRYHVNQVLDALRALARSFITHDADYLIRTATLHDFISLARGPSGIPPDNQSAVRHAWKLDRDALDDNLQEAARIIEQTESQSQSDLDDGWDEIGFSHTPMDDIELARANKVHQVLRLTTLLHKRIYLDILPYTSSAPLTALDSLLLQSNHLLSTSDDLVAALYSPQDPDHIRAEILQLTNITTSLQPHLAVFLSPTHHLSQQLQAVTLDNAGVHSASSSATKKRADKKWFDTCVDHICRLAANLTDANPAV